MSFSIRNNSTSNIIPVYNSSSLLSIPITTVKPNNDQSLVYNSLSNQLIFSSGITGPQGFQGVNGPTGFQGIIGPQGFQGVNGPTGIQGNVAIGNTIQVDSVYGNDATGAAFPYSRPFLTITAALSYAQSGQLVFINPGTYNESITIPDNVSVNGAGAQCVIIQKLNVTQNTTLITVGSNCRLENFTANLSSSGNYDLTCVDFPSGTSITTKIRNSIWNVTSTATNTPTIVGAKSSGTSSTAFTAVNAIQRSTINVISNGNGISRGIYINGPNRFAVRDIVVYARGSGSNIVGVETTDANAYAEIKTSTVSGVLYDINRTAGEILLGFTDLRNNKANGNSFSVVTQSLSTTFGIIGNLGSNTTYYLVPCIVSLSALPSSPFSIPFSQRTIIFAGTIIFTGTIPSGGSITFHIYKNSEVSPVYSMILNPGETMKSYTTTSIDFSAGDTYNASLITVGNPTSGTFSASISFY